MQYPIVLFALVVGVYSANVHKAHLTKQQSAKVLEYSVDCIKQSGVNPEVIAKARNGQFTNDEGFKKFTLCFFQKTGILSSDGTLNEEVALSKLPAEVDKAAIKKVLEECKMKTGKDAADTAFQIFKCYYKATPTHITF